MRAFGLASLSEYHTLRPRRPHWTLVGQQVRQCQLTARCLEIAADTLLEVVGIQVLLQVPVVTISMLLLYLFPFSALCTVVNPCTASSILLEMGRREPRWKTSPPFSPQWTRALQSIKKPPYPSSRAQNSNLIRENNWLVRQVCLLTSFPITTQATIEPEKTVQEVEAGAGILPVILTTSASPVETLLSKINHLLWREEGFQCKGFGRPRTW